MHFGRAAQRVDHAGELDEQPVAGGFNDAAPVLGDLGVDQLTAMRLQPREGAFLVRAESADYRPRRLRREWRPASVRRAP